MFCSSCGAPSQPNLSYCNRCGASLSPAKVDSLFQPPPHAFAESLVLAIVAVFVLGVGSIIALMAIMKKVVELESGVILAISLLVLGLTVIIEGFLIYMVLNSRKEAKSLESAERMKDNTTKELREPHGRVLAEPIPSVTENTTRTFEPVYREQKEK